MRTVADWIGEYGQSHTDPTNELLHRVCVPLIVISIVALLWRVPVPVAFAAAGEWLNWATIVAALALVYYVLLSIRLAAGLFVALALVFLIVSGLEQLPWPLWMTALCIFVAAWIGQFIGHAVEGKRPSFFRDIQFLLIGPLWLVAGLYRRLGIRY